MKGVLAFIRGHLLLFVWPVIIGVSLYSSIFGYQGKETSFSELLKDSKSHTVASATIIPDEHQVQFKTKSGEKFYASYPASFEGQLVADLESDNVVATVNNRGFIDRNALLLFTVVAMVIAGLFGGSAVRKSTSVRFGRGKVDVTKSKGKNLPKERFSDVLGVPEAVQHMQQLVDFLKNPEAYEKRGIKIPRGVILYGPPGTGKTLLATATAGEAGVPFIRIASSDLIGKYAGESSERVRSFFGEIGKEPMVVFVDELDGIGTARTGEQGADRDRNSTLNQLLHEIDEAFGKNSRFILIAATNRLESLDEALTRPDRLGVHIAIPDPDAEGREAILRANTKKIKGVGEIDFVFLARLTAGLSGAALAGIPNRATLLALQETPLNADAAKKGSDPSKAVVVEERHFIEALAIEAMGLPRTYTAIPPATAQLTAYHEAGHALAAMLNPAGPQPFRVTIIPVGESGGSNWLIYKDETYLTRDAALATITQTMGGFAAEQVINGKNFSSGSSDDRQKATRLATEMVCELGMGSFGAYIDPARLNSHPRARSLQAEITEMVDAGSAAAVRLLEENKGLLEAIKEKLLVNRTIGRQELAELFEAHRNEKAPAVI